MQNFLGLYLSAFSRWTKWLMYSSLFMQTQSSLASWSAMKLPFLIFKKEILKEKCFVFCNPYISLSYPTKYFFSPIPFIVTIASTILLIVHQVYNLRQHLSGYKQADRKIQRINKSLMVSMGRAVCPAHLQHKFQDFCWKALKSATHSLHKRLWHPSLVCDGWRRKCQRDAWRSAAHDQLLAGISIFMESEG